MLKNSYQTINQGDEMSKKLKIKSIKCYQSVEFGPKKGSNNYFSIIQSPGKPQISISVDTLGSSTDVIRIESEEDVVHVPFTNISAIQYVNKRDEQYLKNQEVEKSKTSKTGVKASEIKRPI